MAGDDNGITIENGPDTVAVTIRMSRNSGHMLAQAVLTKNRNLRLDGVDKGKPISASTKPEIIRMAVQELVGAIEPTDVHVVALERLLAAAEPEDAAALSWALDTARGRTPTPQKD